MIDVDIILPRKNFDVKVQASFPNGITGVYGPSGSGKTSLLHSISGLALPKQGKVTIGERTLFDSETKFNLPVEKRNIGYVFQEGRLFPHMSVEQNLLYGYKKGKDSKVSFDELVDLLNLAHLLKSKPSQISGGERQRTALGRSLLSSPDILLLDEPFSAVDVHLRKQILPFIIKIQKRVQIPILVVSHELPDLLKMTNRLFVMKEGLCIGHGEYHDLLKMPSVSNLIGREALVNAIDMKVAEIKPDLGLILLCHNCDDHKVQIKCENDTDNYQLKQALKIFINANDIALSKHRLENVTIQNQIEGQISEIVERGASALCIVDVGFKLIVEITLASQKRMGLEIGSRVWCLFKSVAIDVAD